MPSDYEVSRGPVFEHLVAELIVTPKDLARREIDNQTQLHFGSSLDIGAIAINTTR